MHSCTEFNRFLSDRYNHKLKQILPDSHHVIGEFLFILLPFHTIVFGDNIKLFSYSNSTKKCAIVHFKYSL
jgi:hypothetical protein